MENSCAVKESPMYRTSIVQTVTKYSRYNELEFQHKMFIHFKWYNYSLKSPMKNLLLYILFKKASEQSGNNYDIICQILNKTFILESSTSFSILLDDSRTCSELNPGMKKKVAGNSRFFQKLP